MDAFNTYKQYVGIKSHFNTEYDYIKYRSKLNVSVSAWNKRNDIYYFERLSRKLRTSEIVPYFVANFYANNSFYIEDDGSKTYNEFIIKFSNLQRNFINDINILKEISNNNDKPFKSLFLEKENSYPPLLEIVMHKYISVETFCILYKLFNFKWFTSMINYDIILESYLLNINNYEKFIMINTKSYKQLTHKLLFD